MTKTILSMRFAKHSISHGLPCIGISKLKGGNLDVLLHPLLYLYAILPHEVRSIVGSGKKS
jgi:hypothetical protein